jgi:soluble lytic murein transglycosylase
MRRRLALVAFSIWVILPGALAPRSPHASKAAATPSTPSAAAGSVTSARLLARHGEPRVALEALLGGGRGVSTDDDVLLAARLLAATGRAAAAESLLAAATAARRGVDFRSTVQRARLLVDAGRFDAALERLSTIEERDDPLYAAYRDYLCARALLARGEPARAAAALERARETAPEALLPAIDGARVDVYRALGLAHEALAASGDAVDDPGDAPDRRRRLQLHFDLAVEAGDRAEASRAARRLFDEHGKSAEAGACAVAVVRRRMARESSTEFLLRCASVLGSHGHADALRAVLRVLDERSLSAADAEAQRLLWGEYHYLDADYSRAIALARPSYTDPALRRGSMLLMARSFKRVGRAVDAAAIYEHFADAFPNDALAAEALYAAAALYRERGHEADHDRVLDHLRHAYPSTFHGWAASMARANSFASSGQYEDAEAIFEQWLARSRRTDEAALFYLARLERATGDPAAGEKLFGELQAVNPHSFYLRPDVRELPAVHAPAGSADGTAGFQTWLAGASARRDLAYHRVLETASRAEPAAGAGVEAEAAGAALERGRFFLAAGFGDWAERELEVARARGARSAAGALALARLYDDHAMPWQSMRLYERARSGIPWSERRAHADDFRYLTHPLPYPVQVLGASARDAVAPHLLYGMMREESRFDAEVVSRSGAVGLMQLMPETARQVARKIDRSLEVDDRLGDPEINVALGSWYAADLLRAGEGSVAWMLAAYNAGPGAARRWIRPGVTGEAAVDAVESIDYRETRGYVKRVVESAHVYHELYFDGGEKASSGPR